MSEYDEFLKKEEEGDYGEFLKKEGEPGFPMLESARERLSQVIGAVPRVQEAGFDPTTAFLPKPLKTGLGRRFAKNLMQMAGVQAYHLPKMATELAVSKPGTKTAEPTGEKMAEMAKGLAHHFQEYVKETGKPFSWENIPQAFLAKISKDPGFFAMDVFAGVGTIAALGKRFGIGKIKPKVKVQKVRPIVEKPKPQIYKPKSIEDARIIRQEQNPLSQYGFREQSEWLGGQKPSKTGKLTLYRATPTGEPIKPGDYVTNSSAYARQHIISNLGRKGKITKIEATLDDIFPADAPKEFWYAPKEMDLGKPKTMPKKVVYGEEALKAKAAVEKAVAEKGKAQKPWEMTQKEYTSTADANMYISENYPDLGGVKKGVAELQRSHKRQVEQALSENKSVPPEVLKDYPELAKPKPGPTIPKEVEPLAKEAIPSEAKPPKFKNITEALTSAERAARERIKKRGMRLTVGIDPAELADYAIIGAAKIAKGTIKFAEWSREMVKEFGDTIKPYLAKIYNESKTKQTDLMREYGKIEVAKGKERGFVTSVKEEVPGLRKKVAGQYVPRGTDELAIKARTLIETDMTTAERLAKTGTTDKAVATAGELIKYYSDLAQKSDKVRAGMFYDKAAEYANTIAPKLTELGRSVQAASIVGRLTPEGMLRFAAKEIQRYNEKAALSRFGKKIPEITGEQSRHILEETRKIEAMPDGTEKAMAFRKIQDYIADLVPSPFYKKIINVWKAGLLTGIKTSGLNTSSNLFHGISEIVKDIPAVGIDKVASLFTKKRTIGLTAKGVPGGIKEGFGKGWRYLKTGFDERNVAIKLDYRRIGYGNSKFAKGIQAYEQFVFKMMGAEDQPFYYGAKARSLSSQAIAQAKNRKLRGKPAQRFVDELIENPTDEMIKNAVNDAEISVFQNQTYLGQAARQVQKIPGGEAVVPFGRTPAAVATQLVHYSPVGIAKTIIENIGKGKFNQRMFAHGIGRGLTGTAVLAIGTELYKKGLITLDYPSSEKERKLWELEGRKANSIKIAGAWRNPNVFGPLGMTLIIGGHFQNGLDETGSVFRGLVAATSGGAATLTDQTFLRGLNQAISALNDPSRFFSGYVTGTAASIIPTIVSDVARTTDIKERRTESIPQRIKSRIPGLRQTLEPRVDVLGQHLERGGGFLDTMINPTRPSKIKSSPVIDELRRLWDEGYRVTPSQLGNRAGYEGLIPAQNTKLWELTGTLIEKSLTSVIQTEVYTGANDEDKAKLLDKFIREAKLIARVVVAENAIKDLTGEERKNKLLELKQGRLITNQVIKKMFERIQQPEELSYGISP